MDIFMSSVHMWLTFAVIVGAISLYASERFPVEHISLGTIAMLLVIFHMVPQSGPAPIGSVELLAGFSHSAVITILALMVIGQGMSQTGAFDGPTTLLLRYGRHRPKTLIFVCFLFVMALSAFLNDTPVVVMFMPIMIVLAEKLKETPGRVLMPLSFAAILGGMTTLIGTSTNLLVAGAFQSTTGQVIGFFDFTVPGAILAITGFLYLWIAAPFLLRSRESNAQVDQQYHGRQFIIQLTIGPNSPLLGREAVAGMFPGLEGLTIRVIQRRNQAFLPPFGSLKLSTGDVVIAAATRDRLHDILGENEQLLLKGDHAQGIRERGDDANVSHMFEVLVPPASLLEGRTLQEVGTALKGGGTVVGVQRKSRMARLPLLDIRLEAGDILLVCGSVKHIRKLRTSRDVVLMEWSGHAILDKQKKWLARLTFLGTVVAAAGGLLPIVVAALIGAFTMIALGCLTVQQASRAVNRRVYLLVVAALAMGTAMQASGGAAFLAHSLVSALEGASPAVALSILFFVVAFISNILSNNTTAILFTPVVIDMAAKLDLPALPFVVTVIFAANCSFATPVSYQTNLLVMGPGRYIFADYVRFGLPLALLLWLVSSMVVPWYYGL